MQTIHTFDVTYGAALAPAGYHRVTLENGGSANLSLDERGDASSQSFLWYSYVPSRYGPIIDIAVVYDSEPAPEGFEKISRALVNSNDRNSSYLCIKKSNSSLSESDRSMQPLCSVIVSYGKKILGDSSVLNKSESGQWEMLNKSLSPTADVFLWYRRVPPNHKDLWSAFDLNDGDFVSVEDNNNQWCVAKVIGSNSTTVTLQYKSWDERWTETISRASKRLAQHLPSLMPSSIKTFANMNDACLDDVTDMEEKVYGAVNGDFEQEASESILQVELPSYIEKCMLTTFQNVSKDLPAANDILQLGLEVLVKKLATPDAEISISLMNVLKHVCIRNTRFGDIFYKKYCGSASATDVCSWPLRSPHIHGIPLICDDPELNKVDKDVLLSISSKNNEWIIGGRRMEPASLLWFTNVSYFHLCGGYKAILIRLREPSKVCSMDELRTFISFFQVTIDLYNGATAPPFFEKLKCAVDSRLERLTVPELKDYKEAIEKNVHSELDLTVQELQELWAGLKIRGILMLTSSFIAAIQSEKAYISSTGYYRSNSSRYSSISSSMLADWSTKYGVLEYIFGDPTIPPGPPVPRQFPYDESFSSSKLPSKAHIELLKRCEQLLNLMVSKKQLTLRHVELLWAAGIGQQEAQQRCVYSLLVQLASKVDIQILSRISKLACSLSPLSEERQVEFIKELALLSIPNLERLQAVNNSEAHSVLKDLLTVLWSAAVTSTSAVGEISAKALAYILSDASKSLQYGERNVRLEEMNSLIEKCISGITEGKMTIVSLRVLQLLMDSQPCAAASNRSESRYTKDRLLMNLNKKNGIVNLIVSNLDAYRSRVKKTVKSPDDSLMDEVLFENITHAIHIRNRLDFLKFMAESSPTPLDFPVLEILWSSMVISPLCPAECSTFFVFLNSVAPRERIINGVYVTMNLDTSRRVLQDLLCKQSDWSKLPVEAYKCLEKYFNIVNQLNDRTKLIQLERLIGFDTLWKVLCDTDKEETVEAVSKFLVQLHVSLMVTQPKTSRDLVDLFIKRSMGLIDKNRSHLRRSNKTVLARVLHLLQLFLKEANSSFKKNDPFSFIQDSREIHVQVQRQVGRHSKLVEDLTVPTMLGPVNNLKPVTVGMIRAIMIQKYRVPGDHLHLVTPLRDHRYPNRDSIVIPELKNNGNDIILNAIIKEERDPSLEWDPPLHACSSALEVLRDFYAPTEQLSNREEYFGSLISLASLDCIKVADAAWDLLCTLPVNSKIFNEMKTLNGLFLLPSSQFSAECLQNVQSGQINGFFGSVSSEKAVGSSDWKKLLPEKSIVTLLYRLRTLIMHLRPLSDAFSLPGDKADAEALQRALIERGGLSHLFSLLGGKHRVKFDASRKLHKTCIAMLMELCVNVAVSLTGGDPSLDSSGERERKSSDEHSILSSNDSNCNEDCRMVVESQDDLKGNSVGQVKRSNSLADLIEGFDPKEIVQQCLKYMAEVTRTVPPQDFNEASAATENEVEAAASLEAEVVKHAMRILVELTSEIPELLEVVLSFKDLQDTLHFGLLKVSQPLVRHLVADGVFSMIQSHTPPSPLGKGRKCQTLNPARFFLLILLESLDAALLTAASVGSYYFDLLVRLVKIPTALQYEERLKICETIAWKIKKRPIVEETEEDEDVPLCGCFMFLRYAIENCDVSMSSSLCLHLGLNVFDGTMGLIHEIFFSCLFAHPHFGSSSLLSTNDDVVSDLFPDSPKCKSKKLRHAAFRLLSLIARGHPQAFGICANLCSVHHNINLTKEQRDRERIKEDRRRRRVSRTVPTAAGTALRTDSLYRQGIENKRLAKGYCGLKNLGCICYMNATIQQLFMTPRFREAVLAFEGEKDLSLEDRDESFMWQLQLMFAHLQESDKAYFNPIGFCQAMRDYDNQPIDVLTQQDASEFVAVFLQQLEGKVMGSPVEAPLRETFGGVFSNELIASEGRRSERPEPFSTISVAVKDFKSLNVALENFVAGETVDYRWGDGEDAKTLPTLKRLSIRDLPPHLIIHLKRFEFDFGTMQQVKINDRFEFPFDLDMKPFTTEGRVDEKNTDAGDTFGIADPITRAVQAAGMKVQQPDNYYSYQLAGVVVHMGTANSGHYYSFIRERCGSRRWFEFNDNIVSEFDPSELEAECFGGNRQRLATAGGLHVHSWLSDRNAFMLVYDRVSADTNPANAKESSEPFLTRFRAKVPEAIMAEIRIENFEFWHKRHIQNILYFNFMKDFIQGQRAWKSDMPSDGLTLGLKFALGTLQQAGQFERVPEWCRVLGKELEYHPAVREWLLTVLAEDSDALKDITLTPNPCRPSAVELVCSAVKWDVRIASVDEASPHLSKSTQLIIAMLSVLGQWQDDYWSLMGDYFYPVLEYARSDTSAAILLLKHGVLGQLMTLFLQYDVHQDLSISYSYSSAYRPKSTINGLGPEEADYTSLSAVICYLLCACDLRQPSCILEKIDFEGEQDDVELERMKSEQVADQEAAVTKKPSRWATLSPLWELPAECQETPLLIDRRFTAKVLRGVFLPVKLSSMAMALKHMVWRSRAFVRLVVKEICEGVSRETTREDLKPYFCAVAVLIDGEDEDGLSDWRIGWTMRHLLEMMSNQKRFIKATEISISLLIRLAELRPEARKWLKYQLDSSGLEWMLQILRSRDGINTRSMSLRADKNSTSPYHQSISGALSSAGRGDHWGARAVSPHLRAHIGAAALEMATSKRLREVLSENASERECYHSDTDPEEVIGRSIIYLRAKSPGPNAKLVARIIGYDVRRGEHLVLFENEKEPKSLVLLESLFEFKS